VSNLKPAVFRAKLATVAKDGTIQSMPTMNVSLPEDLDDFVAEQLKEGGYNNQSEVVREGLRLLRIRQAKFRRLRADLDLGIADLETGQTKPLTDELLRDIADRGRQRAAIRKTPPA
jgi:antitoxin ParD1/3/4